MHVPIHGVRVGCFFGRAEALNRSLVLAIVRVITSHGLVLSHGVGSGGGGGGGGGGNGGGAGGAGSTAVLVDFLAKIEAVTPLRWSPWALDSWPADAAAVKTFYAGTTPPNIDTKLVTACESVLATPSLPH
jgi:hypothetical protein